MHWKFLVIVGLILAALAAPLCAFTVDRTEFVYLTQFGRPLATYDGANDDQAGLHFKWPWPVQSVQRLDRRLQYFDLPGQELLTHDPKRNTADRTLTIDAYVCWRIADANGVDRFVRSVGTPGGAQAVLGQRIYSELGAAIGQMKFDDLISTDPKKVDDARIELRKRLLKSSGAASPSLEAVAESEYGIQVVDIRLRRSNHPAAVRDAIFERIRSERKQKAADYEVEGERLAADIKSDGALRVAKLKADSEAQAAYLRSQADAEADRIRNEAQIKDPEFYTFLKRLETYQSILGDGKSTLLLSTHHEIFNDLFRSPSPSKRNSHKTYESHEKTQRKNPEKGPY
jgi:modulator of FtsH protease HflC